MQVIRAGNAAEAWASAAEIIEAQLTDGGISPSHPNLEQTRNGPALVVPEPVTTVYERPLERVILDPVRDANPFFHLMEALWMLAGRDDATWLDQFIGDFSSRYAEPDGTMHGAYGKRWRGWFGHPAHTGHEDSTAPAMLDQLDEVVRLLRENPRDRQAVIQMWDPEADLGVPGLKDRPCNQQVLLRVRSETPGRAGWPDDRRVLDITVTCRSNDAVFGCYGANVVHFSVLQEYLAARIGVGVGRYYQVSNNWHVYESSLPRVSAASARFLASSPYPGGLPLVADPTTFDSELAQFMHDPTAFGCGHTVQNKFLLNTASPMFVCNLLRRKGLHDEALRAVEVVHAPDWRMACVGWLRRREDARAARAVPA